MPMEPGFSLRALTAEDGALISALSDQSSDSGAVGFHSLYHYDAYATLMALHENACGVIAEAGEQPGIVGMGMMSLGTCQYEGSLRPFAYLFSLSVHPQYRRRGIASQLAAWRIRQARERIGAEGVVYAGIQGGNTASLRTAARWSSQLVSSSARVAIVKMRSAPWKSGVDWQEVRPAAEGDWEAAAHHQNAFYAEHNLYPPRTAEETAAWHNLAPFGERIREYYLLRDRRGNLLAGCSVTEEGRLVTIEITRMSGPFRAANALVKIFPAGGRVRRLHVKDLWYAPGREDAALHLWETLRWQLRERGNLMMFFFDSHTPLAQVIRTPWYMPRAGGSLALSAPQPMSDHRPVYFIV